MRETVPSVKLVTHRSSPVTTRARGSCPTSIVCCTACVDGLIFETVSSPALTTQIAPSPAASAIGFVPTGTEPTPFPDSSSSLTALAGTSSRRARRFGHGQCRTAREHGYRCSDSSQSAS